MLFLYVGVRVFENAWGGLIVSGDIYKYSHPHICTYIYIYIEQIINIFIFLFHIVPTSGLFPPDGPVILLIWVCRSGTVMCNA